MTRSQRAGLLRRLAPAEVEALDRFPVDSETLDQAAAIVSDIRRQGADALRGHAQRLGDIDADADLVIDRSALEQAKTEIGERDRALLERTAARIESFALAQRKALTEIEIPVPGGRAGHQVAPVERAGCYAPGGRYPLPSSVLMTAVTARAAGVGEVWVASPRPAPVTLAAAAIAGADGVLAVGGAQAIAAMAFGHGIPAPCDIIVGPGNRWVTAAKQLVAGQVGIDILAGPSELVVLADANADPRLVAADLLAQAEHDPDALPVLVSTSSELVGRVDEELDAQLRSLPTAAVARAALEGGFAVICEDVDEAIAVCDRLAPEHLEVMTDHAATVARRLGHWGGLFVGSLSAEVLGDYGAGPNHTLPTGRSARFAGGLSVFDFLRVRTWIEVDDASGVRAVLEDAVDLARLEGLEAHARAAIFRQES